MREILGQMHSYLHARISGCSCSRASCPGAAHGLFVGAASPRVLAPLRVVAPLMGGQFMPGPRDACRD